MNARKDVTARSPNDKDELCAEFTIDDAAVPFVLSDVTEIGQSYVLSFWARSNSNAILKVNDTEILISTEWERYKFSFNASKEDIEIYFASEQKYYLYRAQLEIGTVMTDWSPSPEDIQASLEVKIDTENLISEINASADIIRLTGDRIVIDSTYFKVEEDGTVVASNMTITGTSQFISEQSEDSEDYTGSKVVIENGIVRIFDNQNRMASHNGFESYYGGGDSEDYYSRQSALGVLVYTKENKLLTSLTRSGIFGAEDTGFNWEGNANIKQLNVNGYPVYGSRNVSFKTIPYEDATGRTITINRSMSKCQKSTGHVSIAEQYYLELTSSGAVAAGELISIATIPDMYIPSTRVAINVYANYAKPYIFIGNVSTDGVIEVRPNVALEVGSYYLAVSANYLLDVERVQENSFAIIEDIEDKVVNEGDNVTFRIETDLPGTDTNTQFVWQTSINGSVWDNVKVHTPMANYSEYTISSFSKSQDGLMVRCKINRGDETAISNTATVNIRKQEYTVTYNLTNCTLSNNSTIVIEGESYETYIEFNEGYTYGSGSVIMGNSNITSSALIGDRISISKVTGDITINYTASKIESGDGGEEPPNDYEVTNLVLTSEEQNSTNIYNGIGYKNGIYASESGDGVDESCVATGYIPYKWRPENIIYIRGAEITTNIHVRFYGWINKTSMAGNAYCNGSNISQYFNVEEIEPGTYYKLTPLNNISSVTHIRISLIGTGENLIITVNEEIVQGGGDSSGDNTGSGTGTLSITKQPQSVTVDKTESATFTIEAQGNDLKFQWRVGTLDTNMSDYDATTTTANSSTLTIDPPGFVVLNKIVECIVTDGNGNSVTSERVNLTYSS